jgi:hypothetical protein
MLRYARPVWPCAMLFDSCVSVNLIHYTRYIFMRGFRAHAARELQN